MKKVLALVLVAVMAIGMSATAFAATAAEYDTQEHELGYSYEPESNTKNKLDENSGNSWTFENDVNPQDEQKVYIELNHGMFSGTDNKATNPDGALLNASDVRKSKITVRTQVQGGSKVLKEIKIDGKKGRIEVAFVEEWVSTKEQDFEILVYLTVDGKRFDGEGLTLVGTLANDLIEVHEEFDYVDLSQGSVAEAIDFVDKIEVDLGNGVKMFTKFFKSKKYYGTATREPDEAADIVMKQYPDIDNVVIMKVVGLNSTGDIVKLDTDYSNYYVYNKDMQYVGQSNEMLPYSSVYYLANKQLDVADGEEPTDDDGDEPDEDDGTNPGTGGDNASNNANANPGTGR